MTPMVTTSLALHPDHLADLARSGLTQDDARAVGIYSARLCDIARLIGRDVPDGTSALVFQYHGCDGFVRVKPFPPVLDADGRPLRYLQRAGTGCRLYVPPCVAPLLEDTNHSLAISEGEKKGLAVTKAGWPCVAIGGIWNFTTDGELIADLKAIPWKGRIVRFVPDADVWSPEREDLLLAVYRFARLLEAEGATVFIVKLSPLPGVAKTGADDFLVAKGPAALRRLMQKAITLGHRAFLPLRQQEKQAKRQATASTLPQELVGRHIHPALHLKDDFAAIGILGRSSEELVWKVVTSERRAYLAEAVASALMGLPFPYVDLTNRWAPESVAQFLAGTDQSPRFADALASAFALLESLLEVGRENGLTLLATWAVGTYFHDCFLAFPRLDLRGEMGSGKSKALQILAAMSFSGLLRVSPTPAVLFRLAEAFRPTLCLDEIEGLAAGDKREILAILNAGYKAGGRVDRCEGDDHQVRSYAVYCPVALAGITGLNRVTEDRAITMVLTKGMDPLRLNADVNPDDPRFAQLRDVCFRLALLRRREVAEAYKEYRLPEWLLGRERELWLPLLAVASLADREAELGALEDLLALAKEQGEERAGLSDEGETLLAILADSLRETQETLVSPRDVCASLGERLRWDKPPRPETVGRWLKRLGFHKAPRSADGVRYRVTSEMIEDLQARWGGRAEEPTLLTNLHPLTT